MSAKNLFACQCYNRISIILGWSTLPTLLVALLRSYLGQVVIIIVKIVTFMIIAVGVRGVLGGQARVAGRRGPPGAVAAEVLSRVVAAHFRHLGLRGGRLR